jgi:hypothetical protein
MGNRLFCLAGVAVMAALQPVATLAQDCAVNPQVVVALIDTGINPYNVAFRDPSPMGQEYPGRYIPGYPAGVPALRLSLDAPSYEEALKRDDAVWKAVKPGRLYWIPGTRIAGAISMGSGGTNCPPVPVPPANIVNGTTCPDYAILDNHGHGSMTASRAAGSPHSLAPTARIVEVQGLGSGSLKWVASQSWIDVSSNSWLSLVPPEVGQPVVGDDTANAFADAARRMVVMAASGNGAAYSQGAAPTPTYVLSTAAPGVILVGGHDNGDTTLWSGAPPHIVADAYGGYAAMRTSMTDIKPDSIACCTSAAAPYAAGGSAAIILHARQLLQDPHTGYFGPIGDETGAGVDVSKRVVARGHPGLVPSGPLADGDLTLQELELLLMHTAQARPVEGRDDGLLHPAASGNAAEFLPYGIGANPFCQLCFTTPIPWKDIPSGVPAYPLIGYGAINEFSTDLAFKVLEGKAPMPDRGTEDSFFKQDQTIRGMLYDTTSVTPTPAPRDVVGPATCGGTRSATMGVEAALPNPPSAGSAPGTPPSTAATPGASNRGARGVLPNTAGTPGEWLALPWLLLGLVGLLTWRARSASSRSGSGQAPPVERARR